MGDLFRGRIFCRALLKDRTFCQFPLQGVTLQIMYCRPNESSFHGKGLHLHLCFDPIYGARSTSAADDD